VDIGNRFVITAPPCPSLSDNFCVHTVVLLSLAD
jgi:hypothetical protein